MSERREAARRNALKALALALDDFSVADFLRVDDLGARARLDAMVGGRDVDFFVGVEAALEVLDRLSDALTELRKLVRSKHEQDDHEDDDQLAKTRHAHSELLRESHEDRFLDGTPPHPAPQGGMPGPYDGVHSRTPFMIIVELHSKHAGPVVAGHPWVFAQAVANVRGDAQPGDEVQVVEARGRALGRGFWSPTSAIVVRLLTRDPEEKLDGSWLLTRVRNAVATRALLGLPSPDTTGYRLINAEGDGLAGLVVDRYNDVLVVQLGTVGMQRRKQEVVAALVEVCAPRAVFEVASQSSLAKEGVTSEGGLLYGDELLSLEFMERGLRFALDVQDSQKTGYYFDQREQRAEIERLSQGREVLDACCYVGSFALAASRGGARSVLALDSSRPALERAEKLAALNGLSRIEWLKADVHQELERLGKDGKRFDLTILDPPKLVPTVRHLERGRRAYRRLNRQAIDLVRPGGVLVTCSCSAGMNETDFLRTISLAARDAGRDLSVLRVMRQGPDHPIPPGFSEGMYLKTVFAVVR